ncbi:unnamed protein product [Candidula unifasciata]|uniref:Uncharacterized protein n=1 Tax=Candidula unifasciata TaxID=100452 RepID=A0A8S3YRD7_9EUPU|nr:unnamed protein product [Candidula unifasciata]
MEDMDFESDGQYVGFNSRPCTPQPCAKGRGNQSDLSDMDVDPSSPTAQSSTSFEHINQALKSLLSFNNFSDDTDNYAHHSAERSVLQPTSDPCQKSKSMPSVCYDFKKSLKPAASAVLATSRFKNTKAGYTDTTDDTVCGAVNSQPPEINSSIRQRLHVDDKLSEAKQIQLNSSPPGIKKHKGNHSHGNQDDPVSPKSDSKRCSLCFISMSILIILLLFLVIVYFGTLNSTENCKISRHFNKQVLKIELEANVFGQHLATKIVPDKIEEYFGRFYDNSLPQDVPAEESENVKWCKPLVLSFDGWTGVGKNYISKFISEAFQYSTVMNYVVPYNFPHQAFEDMYRLQIQEWILGNFSKCKVNIVVVDEVDKAFPKVIEGLVASIKELTRPCSSTSPTIFLLLSNTHGSDINRIFVKFLLDSPTKKREEISQEHFHSVFTSEFNDWASKLTDTQLIDAYVPFLPLEREHVIQCIKKDLVSKRFSTDLGTVKRVLEELSISSFGDIQISQTGCKRVADKVDLVMFEK